MSKILGISCSLRNARFGSGSDDLITEIKAIKDEPALVDYLERQTKIRANDFFEAGRNEGLPFDIIYKNLRKAKGDRGLSNSEAALVAGLWGTFQAGSSIMHCGLSKFFPMNGKGRNLNALRDMILQSDGLLISGPVYFGDRSSLAQEFFEFIRNDESCKTHLANKVYAGVAVGAKRNGGQETTLVYQFVDATNLGMLAVGNDSTTTSQYGGTAHAGDVGTLADDRYGIETSIGTGRRLASISQMLDHGRQRALVDKVRISVWLLQDTKDRHGRTLMEKLFKEVQKLVPEAAFRISDYTEQEIYRCIACDVCPTDVGPAEEYRCIIKSKNDLFFREHQNIIDTDGILLAAYSPINRDDMNSIYQRFVERTRYLRRDEYVIGDRLVAPFVISEINSNQNLHIRMMTSFIRQHSVLHHPIIGMEHEGTVLNWTSMLEQAVSFAKTARTMTTGRLLRSADQFNDTFYNPVGYVISANKRENDIATGKAHRSKIDRQAGQVKSRERRIS